MVRLRRPAIVTGKMSLPEADELRATLEADPLVWRCSMFPGDYQQVAPADFHDDFWQWVWRIRQGVRPGDRAEVWFRGAAKTTSAETMMTAVAARGVRRYGLWVSRTQDLADDKVQNVGDRFGDPLFASFYPEHGSPEVTRFGHTKAWRRNRLRTAGGFTIDALGLDAAGRGLKTGMDRPDIIVIDDVDESTDSMLVTERLVRRLTRNVIPARARHAGVLFMQNLIDVHGVCGKLVSGEADFLRAATIVGPIPAIRDLQTERRAEGDGVARDVITGGTPTWPDGFGLEDAQAEVDSAGLSSFMAEHQHQPVEDGGTVFNRLEFRRCTRDMVPALKVVEVWVDPAVEGTAGSLQGIQADGLADDGTIYRLASAEFRADPVECLTRAVRMALEVGGVTVGVESDQGGRVWESAFREAQLAVGGDARGLTLKTAKASQARGSKAKRAQQMLPDYELGKLVHVDGTHDALERALRRFPQEPTDLVDAAFYAWRECRRASVGGSSLVSGAGQHL